MPNIKLHAPKPTPTFRKIAIGTWRTSFDPQVYGTLSLRMEPALKYIEEFRTRTNQRLTVTHLVSKAIAKAFEEMPDANALLRFHRVYPRQDISVFLQVAMEDPDTGKPDLSGTTIHQVNKLSLSEIIETMEENVRKVRTRKDKALEKTRSTFSSLPGFMVHYFLQLTSFLLHTLNLDLARFGLPNDTFGSVLITNIGALGLDQAYAPLVPYTRVPMVIAMGKVSDEPVVEDGEVVAGKVMNLCATFDHRFIDGVHAAILSKTIRKIFANPVEAFGLPKE
jgi:pyruvate dehydrogenase E2 component (dihydrolipoamide acetyltransferase)